MWHACRGGQAALNAPILYSGLLTCPQMPVSLGQVAVSLQALRPHRET